MENNSNNFLDSKTIIAIVMIGLVWLGWQKYLSTKYPNLNQKKEVVEKNQSTEAKEMNQDKGDNLVKQEKLKFSEGEKEKDKDKERIEIKESNPVENYVEKVEIIKDKEIDLEMSTRGMGFKNILLKNQETRDNKKVELKNGANEDLLFEIGLIDDRKPLFFQMSKINELQYEGVAQYKNYVISKKLNYNKEKNYFQNEIKIENIDSSFKGIYVLLSESKKNETKSSILQPIESTISTAGQEVFVKYENTSDRIVVSEKEALNKKYSSSNIVSVGNHYTTSLLLDQSEIMPTVKIDSPITSKDVKVYVDYEPIGVKGQINIKFINYIGPKDVELLKNIDSSLTEVINFGFFSGIAKSLLVLLKWLYSFSGNWGIAIILLTLLVRLLVLPFNIASYKSMKKMQQIQPLLQETREKYKENSQMQNQEIMRIMKENKVNPLGGCLPMLLQMPVFFALYQVLGNSIELYKAPFFGWINDLSLKDPLFILPILMGIAMWLHQKITPSTMDPAQAKIMQFLPIIFSLMMLSLPSGLTLYIFVSTAFGVGQQIMFMKGK